MNEYLDYILKAILGFLVKHILDIYFGDILDKMLKKIKEGFVKGINKLKKKAPEYKAQAKRCIAKFRLLLIKGCESINMFPQTYLLNVVGIAIWLCDHFGLSIINIPNEVIFATMMLVFMAILVMKPRYNNR